MATESILILVVVATSIWVGFDASSIGAKEAGSTGPFGWFLFCLLLWIIGFPLYLSQRSKIKTNAQAAKATAPGQLALPVAGWYPDPASGQQRYWDGSAWGPMAP